MKDMKWFSYVVIAVVGGAVIAGLFLVGSPRAARARAADSIRTSHLSMLQYDISEYWRQKKALPENLSVLRPVEGEAGLPKDPTTHMQYKYSIVSVDTFVLCAVFEEEFSVPEDPYYPRVGSQFNGPFIGNDQLWSHGIGEVCFTRRMNTDYFRELERDSLGVAPSVSAKPLPIID